MFGNKKKSIDRYGGQEDLDGEYEYDYDYEDEEFLSGSHRERQYDNPEIAYLNDELTKIKAKARISEMSMTHKNTLYEELLSEKRHLEKTVNRLVEEVNFKQNEVEQLAVKLLNSSETVGDQKGISEELLATKHNLETATNTIYELQGKLKGVNDLDSYTTAIMLETQKATEELTEKAKAEAAELIDDAHKQSEGILSSIKIDLNEIKRVEIEHYKQLEYVRQESGILFEQLLSKLATVLEE